MKNFTLALLGLLSFALYSPAEVIDTVTFNPARLGQYERLKVSDGLTSHGGVQTQSMAVQSNGDVTLENEGNYQIPQTQINGYLNMPSTRFETPKLSIRGGTAYFDETAGTDIQSHIDELTQTALRVKANVLEVQNMTVKGISSPDYDGNSIQGLKLGGNDIPKPSSACSGLTWVPRVDNEGNTYQVLGMTSCGPGGTVYCKVVAGSPISAGTTRPDASLDTCNGNVDASTADPWRAKDLGGCVDYHSQPGSSGAEQTNTYLADLIGNNNYTDNTPGADKESLYTCTSSDYLSGKTYIDVYVSIPFSVTRASSVICDLDAAPPLCCSVNRAAGHGCDDYKAAGGSIWMWGEGSGFVEGDEAYCKDLAKIGWLNPGGTYSCSLYTGQCLGMNGQTTGAQVLTCHGGLYSARRVSCQPGKEYYKRNLTLDCSETMTM